MSTMELLSLSIKVLCDWRVLFIAVFSIVFMMAGSYVVKYRKRPPRIKVKKAAPAPAPAAEKKEENEEASEE